MESQISAASIETIAPGVVLDGVEVLPTRPRRANPPLAAVPPAPQPIASPAPQAAAPQAQAPRIVQRHAQILDMFTVFARILAARFLLFLALIGAFILALEAMGSQTIPAIAVLVAYSVLTIGPLVGIELRGKRG